VDLGGHNKDRHPTIAGPVGLLEAIEPFVCHSDLPLPNPGLMPPPSPRFGPSRPSPVAVDRLANAD
jgi:hypothetical protein